MSNKNYSGGISMLSLLFLVFLVMKLAKVGEVASWTWWAVTAPLWGPLALCLAALIVIGIVWVIGIVLDKIIDLSRRKNNAK